MALTDTELMLARTYVPASWGITDEQLNVAADAFGSWQAAAAGFIREALMALADPTRPASFTIPGEYAQDVEGNMRYLAAKLSELEAGGAIPGAARGPIVAGRIVRPDADRGGTARLHRLRPR